MFAPQRPPLGGGPPFQLLQVDYKNKNAAQGNRAACSSLSGQLNSDATGGAIAGIYSVSLALARTLLLTAFVPLLGSVGTLLVLLQLKEFLFKCGFFCLIKPCEECLLVATVI